MNKLILAGLVSTLAISVAADAFAWSASGVRGSASGGGGSWSASGRYGGSASGGRGSWSATGARGGTASGGGGSWSATGARGGTASRGHGISRRCVLRRRHGLSRHRRLSRHGLSLWRCRRRSCCRRGSYNLGLCGLPAALLPASVRLLPLSGLPVVDRLRRRSTC